MMAASAEHCLLRYENVLAEDNRFQVVEPCASPNPAVISDGELPREVHGDIVTDQNAVSYPVAQIGAVSMVERAW